MRLMMRSFAYTLIICFWVTLIGKAQPLLKQEHLSSGWNFSEIMRPARNDAARHSSIAISGEQMFSSLSPNGLHIGVLPQENRLLRDFFCFGNQSKGGKIIMQLDSLTPVVMVNTYSAHGPVGGTTWCNEFDGSRGPQVYTLYGSADLKPDFQSVPGNEWVKIADVDTRPSTDSGWEGTYGVNIRNADGSLLGKFRWLLWDVKPTLKPGSNPEWTNTWYCELDVHTPATLKSAGDAVMAGAELDEIVMAFKSHFDIGFTHPAPEIVNNYRTEMIDRALKLIENSYNLPKEKQFEWTIPSWVAWQILWSGQDSVRKSRVIKAMKRGSLIVHGLPVTVETESLEPEDLIFGLSLNKIVSHEAGIPISRSGKMTDVPSHSWILPGLLKNAGFDFLHIGVNPCNERPNVPLLYYWQGPDCSKLLTMQTQGYGSDCEFGHGLYPPKDWPYKHWLALIVATDNAGPPNEKELGRLLGEAEKNLPHVKVRMGKMEDFANAIFDEEKKGAKVPVVNKDMPDCWIHGFGTMPVEEGLARRVRKQLTSLEVLDFQMKLWGLVRPDINAELFNAHERSLMFGEHTWGGSRNLEGKNAYQQKDFESFAKSDKDCQWLENTWKDHANYIDSAAHITDLLSKQTMQQLAGNISGEGKRLVVFNPLPWKRNALVDLPGTTGKTVVKDIPACGYKTVEIPVENETFESKKSESVLLENQFLKIKIDRKKGGIVSVIDKKSGRELVDQSAPYAFGQYLYQRFDRQQMQNYHIGCSHLNTVYGSNGRCCSGWNIRADLPDTPLYQSAVPEFQTLSSRKTWCSQEVVLFSKASGLIQSDVKVSITLPNEFPWFEINVQLFNKKADYWPETGSVYLPVKASDPQFRIGRLGGATNPAVDFVEGSNRTYGYVSTGAVIAGKSGEGLAICPLDNGLMSFGEKGMGSIDPLYIPTKPLALVSMFNNLWTINFPYWIKGSLSSRVRIWATDQLNYSSLAIPAMEARQPVLTAITSGTKGSLPLQKEGIKISRKGISLMVNNDNGKQIVRLWEQAGEGGELEIEFPLDQKALRAVEVNLRDEETGKTVEIKNHKLEIKLPAWSVVSFRLE